MKLQKDQYLFFGCKIDSKMREALSQARPGDRKYFEGDSDEFLQICTFEQEKWVGKVLKVGMNTGEIEDIHRNIASILRRISPSIRVSTSAIKILHAIPEEVVVEEAPVEQAQGTGGPYIDY